jgi:antitoxin component HigA of HigAB toxin-antitoxin module
MTNVLEPRRLRNESEYRAAVGEMRDLIMADPQTPDGRRFDELLRRIEEFEDTHGLAAPSHVTAKAKTRGPSLRLV